MKRPPPTYGHPMGWFAATLFGIAYGGVLAGALWLIWCAVSLARPSWRVDLIFAVVFLMGVTTPLLIESVERDNVKRGSTNLGRKM